ncbi:MAG TPA: transposase, partial [Rectinema sp.]|nr:transposase [Rectinema sp.]
MTLFTASAFALLIWNLYNIMFLWFCQLSMENPVPDHSTICRWRSGFSDKGIYEKLLHEINHQL